MDRIRCFLRKKKRGSLTVEASIVFPIAVMLLCLILWASMLLHDRVSAAAWVCDQTQRADFQKESGAGQEEPRLLILSERTETERGENRVTVACEGRERLLSAFGGALFSLEGREYAETQEAELLFGENVVRKRRFGG